MLKLDKSKKYLLAVSFGPDSMALFDMLYKNGYKFDCAIVNYHLRKESDSEVKGLLDYSKDKNIKVFVKDAPINSKTNIEATCRKIRYQFFKELYLIGDYSSLLVAHNQDDHLETYLMQISRQICPIYYGISEKTQILDVPVIRPLLNFNKSDLLKYCDENNVPYAIDATNFDTSILRNHIRHDIIGKMSGKDREKLRKEIDKRNDELKTVLKQIDQDRLKEVNYLLSLDSISLKYALNMLVKQLGKNKFLSKENVGEIKKALLSKKPNIVSRIKQGVYLVKEYGFVEFSKTDNFVVEYSYKLNKPGKLDTPYFHLDFKGGSAGRNVKIEDYPLTIRNIKTSDFLHINGYKVTANRMFIDWKMPYRLRFRWPVIVNKDNKVIYIPRYQKGFIPTKESNFFVKL